MSKNAKTAIISLIGLIGLAVLLVGAITDVYATTTGVIIAVVLWIGSGILAGYWGVKKRKS